MTYENRQCWSAFCALNSREELAFWLLLFVFAWLSSLVCVNGLLCMVTDHDESRVREHADADGLHAITCMRRGTEEFMAGCRHKIVA